LQQHTTTLTEPLAKWQRANLHPPYARSSVIGGIGSSSQVVLNKPSQQSSYAAYRSTQNSEPTGLPTREKLAILEAIVDGRPLAAADGEDSTSAASTLSTEPLTVVPVDRLPSPEPLDDGASDSDPDLSQRRFRIGEQYDLLDSSGKWLPAQVINVLGDRVVFSIERFNDRFNEIVPADSERIADAGTHLSRGRRRSTSTSPRQLG